MSVTLKSARGTSQGERVAKMVLPRGGELSHMPGVRLAHVNPLRWLGQRDRGFAALRRATRTAIIMPAMFALGDKVIGNPQVATFAAFGSFAMLLLADFGGPMAERLQAQAALAAPDCQH